MDIQSYWTKKLSKYSQEEWSNKPSIFATQAVQYFPKTGSLLDLGAGLGQDSSFFARQGYKVLATDISQFALDKIQGVNTQYCDLSLPLPFSPNSFNIIYSHLGLHFFNTKRTRQLFSEIYTILSPGGIFATLVNTIDDPEAGVSKKIGPDLYITPSGLQKRLFSPKSLALFTKKFETLLLDSQGETYKDNIKILVRFVGRKPLT